LVGVDEQTQDAIWREVPHLVVPLQERVARLSGALCGATEVVSSHRIEKAMQYQREAGDYYWMALEDEDPAWLEDKYDGLHHDLGLDNVGHATRVAGYSDSTERRAGGVVRRPADIKS
jgi:hypothetical protein